MSSCSILLLFTANFFVFNHAADECIINEQIVSDCQVSKLKISNLLYPSREPIHTLEYNFSVLWLDSRNSNADIVNYFYVILNDGKLDYIYLKLTDKPLEKLVFDLKITLIADSQIYFLDPCATDSISSFECYFRLQSEYYLGVRIFPPQNIIGGLNCTDCATNKMNLRVEYNLTNSICSMVNSNGTLEGRSYFLFITEWEKAPDPIKLSFSWPVNFKQQPKYLSLDDKLFYYTIYHKSAASATMTLPSSSVTNNIIQYSYFAFPSSVSIGSCLYGKDKSTKLTSFLTALWSLTMVSLVITCCLVVWSKYAECRWNGSAKFVWENDDGFDSDDDNVSFVASDACSSPPRARRRSSSGKPNKQLKREELNGPNSSDSNLVEDRDLDNERVDRDDEHAMRTANSALETKEELKADRIVGSVV